MNKSPIGNRKFSGFPQHPSARQKAYPSASMGGTQEFSKPKRDDKENKVLGKKGNFRKSPNLVRIEN
jgi:hypothetical protein